MAKKDERNLNITINNQENDDDILISFGDIIRKLKKFFALWLVAAIIAGVIGLAVGTAKTVASKPELNALVSFTYSGIEKGLDPTGKKFNVKTIANPVVIENALTSLDMDISHLDSVRRSIKVDGIIPEDSIERITAYKNIYENSSNNSLAAAKEMLDEEIYPTTFKVIFNYGNTGLSRRDSVELLNAILEEYRTYFYKTYGFNKSLGTATSAINYTDYDYGEQIDIFGNTITTVKNYLKDLANEDNTLFRSTQTGYTFNDLYKAAQMIDNIDRDRISSKITVNNITKDKNASIAYYDYRIDNLLRTSTALKERLDTIEDSIAKYEKDSVLIFGNGTDSTDTKYSQASEEYDILIDQRIETSTDLAETKQQIEFYKARKNALQKNRSGSKEMMEDIEKQMATLSDKVANLVELTETTAQEYYENVQYKNAYNVLVPAVYSVTSTASSAVKASVMPIVSLEAIVFVVYLMAAFIASLKATSERKKGIVRVNDDDYDDDDDDDDEDDDDDDDDDIEEVIEEAAEKSTSNKKKKKRK